MPAIEIKRYDDNAPSVQEICKKLGFILSGGCPDWHIYTSITKENTVTVPDDFMAHLALLFGYAWDFGYQNRDEDLKESIKHLKGNIKIVSRESAIEKIVKEINIIDEKIQINIDNLKEMHKKQTQEYKEKIKNLETILEIRQKLRKYNKE